MIEPFVDGQTRDGVISYGLSSYGYDARVSEEFKIFTNVDSATVDPKNFNEKSFVDRTTDICIVPPNSFVLARTVEYFRIPRDVLVICLGKSTYARCGIIVNVTPLEPEWEGHVTLEFSNTTPLPARIYANEGACQFLFLKGEARRRSPMPTARGNTCSSAASRFRNSDPGLGVERHLFAALSPESAGACQSPQQSQMTHGQDPHSRRPRNCGGTHPHRRRQERGPAADGGQPADRGTADPEQCAHLADIATMANLLGQHGAHSLEARRRRPYGSGDVPDRAGHHSTTAPYDLVRRCAPRCWCWARWSRARRGAVSLPGGCAIGTGRWTCTSAAWRRWAPRSRSRPAISSAPRPAGLRGAHSPFPRSRSAPRKIC